MALIKTERLKNFYTAEEHKLLEDISYRASILNQKLEDIRVEQELRHGHVVKTVYDKELRNATKNIEDDLQRLQDEKIEVYTAARNRYIASFNTEDELIEELRTIVFSITLEDFQKVHSHLKPTLENLIARTEDKKKKEELKDISKRLLDPSYDSFLFFIRGRASLQSVVFREKNIPLAIFDNITEEAAARYYKKSGAAPAFTEAEAKIIEAIPTDPLGETFLTFPTSPVTSMLLSSIGAVSSKEELQKYVDRSTSVSNSNVKLDSKIRDDKTAYIRKKQTDAKGKVTEQIGIDFSNIDLFNNSMINKTTRKMLAFLLQIINEQAIHEGKLTKNTVGFDLTELVENGMYSNESAAKRGFNSAYAALASLSISGELLQKGSKETLTQEESVTLLAGKKSRNGYVTVLPNPYLNWGLLTQYFTLAPKWIYRLNNRAFLLAYYIFYIARQRTKQIKANGCFTISFRAIQKELSLPDEEKTKNPQRDIKDEIDRAITEIEETSNTEEFMLTPFAQELAPIKVFLDTGYLEVKLSGSFAKTFIHIAEERQRQIKKAQQHRQHIIDEAQVRAVAKQIEAAPAPELIEAAPERNKQ